jgi:hypothetical protein
MSTTGNATTTVATLSSQKITAASVVTNTGAFTMKPSTYTMGSISFKQGLEDPAFLSITGSSSRPLEANMDGPLPQIGERVELVCVSRGENEMGFALRVIPESYK